MRIQHYLDLYCVLYKCIRSHIPLSIFISKHFNLYKLAYRALSICIYIKEIYILYILFKTANKIENNIWFDVKLHLISQVFKNAIEKVNRHFQIFKEIWIVKYQKMPASCLFIFLQPWFFYSFKKPNYKLELVNHMILIGFIFY